VVYDGSEAAPRPSAPLGALSIPLGQEPVTVSGGAVIVHRTFRVGYLEQAGGSIGGSGPDSTFMIMALKQ